MSKIKVLTPLALVAGLLATFAAPAPVHAQQAYAYQNVFDDNSGLTLTGMWAVDATPSVPSGAPASGGNNLNYNDGTDYDNGASNSGSARTPTINMVGVNSATLSFWCRYATESGNYYDRKFFRILNANTSAVVYEAQVYVGQSNPSQANCPAMNQWHQHTWNTFPAAALDIPIIIEFYFDTLDAFANNYQGWFIDDLVIIADDVTPPVTIADLAGSNPTLSTVDLDWTAPFDDDISGLAASFDLRFATAPITDQNFAQATAVTGEPTPGPEGTPHSVTVNGLNPGTVYYFAIRSTDVAGNQSAVSNVVSLATLAQPSVGGSATTALAPPKDRYNACGAGTAAAPTGLLMLGTLIAMAAAFRLMGRK